MTNEREDVIRRLESVTIGDNDSFGHLSAICRAVYEPTSGWTTGACESLRRKLIKLIGNDDGSAS